MSITPADELDPFKILIHDRLNARLMSRGRSFSMEEVSLALSKYQKIAFHNVSSGRQKPEWAQNYEGIDEQSPDKSALLMRLLEGKLPLRQPGPTSFGMPAYPWIEELRTTSHRVTVNFTGDGVLVDQAGWELVEGNVPAQEMLELLGKGPEAFDEELFLNLCAQGPVWKIRHHTWPLYYLSVGRVRGMNGERDVVLGGHGRASYRDVTEQCYWGPVRLLDQSEFPDYEADGWMLQKTEAWDSFDGIYLEIPGDDFLIEGSDAVEQPAHVVFDASLYPDESYFLIDVEQSSRSYLWMDESGPALHEDLKRAGQFSRAKALSIQQGSRGAIAAIPASIVSSLAQRSIVTTTDTALVDSNAQRLAPYLTGVFNPSF